MSIHRWILAAAWSVLPAAAGAQVRPDAGAPVDGRVAVKVYVTLADEETPYFPVARHRLVFYRGPGDSTVVRTDDAGVATTLLAAGDYRLVSTEAVSWRGATYHWSLPLQVRHGMGVVDLTAKNAAAEPAAASAVAGVPAAASGTTAPAQSAAAYPGAPFPPGSYKDPTTATLFSLLVTGGGQFYSGETGRGLLYLAGGVTGAALVLGAAESCASDYYGTGCSSQSGTAVAGLVLALGSWTVSLIDAHNAAHRHNRRTGTEPAAPARVGAVVAPGARGTALVGVRVAVGR